LWAKKKVERKCDLIFVLYYCKNRKNMKNRKKRRESSLWLEKDGF